MGERISKWYQYKKAAPVSRGNHWFAPKASGAPGDVKIIQFGPCMKNIALLGSLFDNTVNGSAV
jgi:hypothetical protein